MRIPSGVTDQYECADCKAEKPVQEFGLDRHTKRGRKYECKECTNAKRRGRYQAENRKYHLQSKYGITPEQFDSMAARQQQLCAICQQVPAGRSGGRRAVASRGLFVDHDSVSGEVRGLLCHKCNVAIGLLNDDPSRVIRASHYIRGLPVEHLGTIPCGM